MKKTRLILAIGLVSVILLASLGALGYFGIKTMRRSHLRTEAREAFAAEDWKKAEKLLNEYVGLDPDSEEDYVRLAQVYRHFGNTGAEMYCWHRASALNPLKPEYWDNYAVCALNARDFQHLFSSLSRKVILNADLSANDKMRYLICAVMSNHAKDAEKYYEEMLKADPEAFRKDDFAKFAEFLVRIGKLSDNDRRNFIDEGVKSDDPFVRLESILLRAASLTSSGDNAESFLEQKETLLKQAAELNRFAATPLLANFYFSRMKFSSVIEIVEPYLTNIEDNLMSIIYAESCVYSGQPEKLKPLIEHFRSLGRRYRMQVTYFEALYAFSQGEENNDDLLLHMEEIGGAAQTSLATLINLQVALNNDNVEKIVSSLETLMKKQPFYDLQERARTAVRLYLGTKIQENPGIADDPRIIKIARLVSDGKNDDPLLMRILISDLRNRNVLTRQILQENLDAFPLDPYLLQVAAEYELFNGDPGRCLDYVERFYDLKKEERSFSFDLLHMLALELLGKIDEATKEFTALVDNNQMDRDILYRYLTFCIEHERKDELAKMADRLDASETPDLKSLAPVFRAESLFLQEKKDEALALLKTAKTDHPDFAFRAATMLSTYDVLDEALSRYLALLGKYPDRQLILANIAEVYLAKEMKAEALSYAKQAWEMNQNSVIGQYIYAKMLAANGQYQDAEKALRIPNRSVELPDKIRKIWTDIMLHCVQENLEKGQYQRALDLTKHYLTIFPDDSAFLDFRSRAEQELKKARDAQDSER